MQLIWVLLIAVITINVTEAKSFIVNVIVKVLEEDPIQSDVSETSNLSPYVINRRQNISLFPKIPNREDNFEIILNPTMKTGSQTTNMEKYRKPFMKKLLIKDKDNVKVTTEVTTRRSLTHRKNFTIRPHDVYSKTIHKKDDWDSTNMDTHDLENSKIEKEITKSQPDSDENNSEEETQNMNKGGRPINDHDIINIEKQHINISDMELESSKTLVLFPKTNNTNYIIAITPQFATDNKIPSNDSSEDKEKIKMTPEVSNKSQSIEQLEEIIEPKENNSDLERKDVYSKIIHKEDNSNNRNIDTHNLENSKSEKDITKFHPDSEENSSEKKTQNFNTGDMSIEDHDLMNTEKQHIKNNDMGLESSKILLLLFPKRNNTNYIKVNTTQLGTDNQPPSNISSHNHFNSSVKIIEDKGKIRSAPEVSNKSHPIKQLEDIIEPKENNSDLERKDVYSKIIHKEDNSNNRNIDTHNLENSKSEKDITKFHPDSKENSSEKETQNFNAGVISIEDHDLMNTEKQHIKNNDMGLESSTTLLLFFPIRNNTNYIKVNTTQLGSDNQPSSNISSHNHFNSSVKIIEDKGKIRNAPEVSNKSHPIKQLEDIIEPKENNSDLERKDVYSKNIHKDDNSNNRNIDTHNLENSKSEKDTTKFYPDSDENSSKEETQNMNTGDRPINDHDIINIEKQHINNSDIGLEYSKTLVLFPKRNNTNYLKAVTIPFGNDNKTASNDYSHNNSNSNVKIIEDKGKIRSAPEVSNKSHPIKQLEDIIEPKENDSDKEKKDQNEFIYKKENNKNKKLNAKRDSDNNNEMKIRERFRFYSFRKNKST